MKGNNAVQLTLEHKDLTQATLVVANLLKRSATTLPVLSNLLIEAEDGEAIFRGTDLESMARVRIPAKVDGGPGSLTLPADKLSEVVGLLPAGASVSLKDTGGQVELECPPMSYKLVTLPADDYPQWNQEVAETRLHVPQKLFRRLLDAVSYAVPVKDHRRVLMGVYFEVIDGTTLRLTATDGKKLSRMSADIGDVEGERSARAVVSGKLLGDLRKVLGDQGSVTVEFGTRQVAFLVDNIEYRTSVIEGKYPDCDAVIPKDFSYTVRLNREEFKLSARRAGVVSDDRSKSIILRFADNACDFSAMAADVGRFEGSTPVEYDGAPIEIAFNYQLMIETLDSFSSSDILLNLKNESAPCLFKCDAEPEHFCVLMPIKLSDARRPSEAEE